MRSSTTNPESSPHALRRRLRSCPAGHAGWREFEEVCVEILQFLFVPPLSPPHIQARTVSGVERRDAVFPNRNDLSKSPWGFVFRRLDAHLIPFEFKNYDIREIGKAEVLQVSSYLRRETMGRLAFLCSSKKPSQSAYLKRLSIFNEEKKVILFCIKDDLERMLLSKECGKDPAEIVLQLLDSFFIQHE